MEQLTLKEAANSYYSENKHVYSPQTIAAFEAGAEWQKEQYNRLIELIREGIPVLLTEGFDDLVEQIDNELKQLQD